MVKVIFKNLKKSDMVRNIVSEKIEKTVNKFPEMEQVSSTVIVSREHSPEHTGVEWFSVKLLVNGKGIRPIVLEKSAEALYQALAMVSDRALEILHRSLAKERVIHRHKKRKWKSDHKYARYWPEADKAA